MWYQTTNWVLDPYTGYSNINNTKLAFRLGLKEVTTIQDPNFDIAGLT